MGKKKLIHFQENLTFPFLFQPPYPELDHGFVHKSSWGQNFFRNENPLIAELGCGKGEYTVGLARLNPDKNFIGIDIKGARLWRGCKWVAEENLTNVAFVRTRVDHLVKIFGTGELSEIWITFPDPQPGKERLRLTSPVFLAKYRETLRPGGIIHLKTDDLPFYQYTLDVIRDEKHTLIADTGDLYSTNGFDEVKGITTFYEQRWLEMGKKICYLKYQLKEL